jgi:uroporphyrinogen-III synthase
MSLDGRGVVITRPRELADSLAGAIARRGGRAVLFPAIAIEELPPPDALRRMEEFQLVVFVSPSAVRVALRTLPQWPSSVAAAAIGAGTRRELERHGVSGVIAPQSGADSEALLATPELADVADKRVLIVRGEGGRALLGNLLAARGARVDFAECYRRVRPVADAAPLIADWQRGRIHAVSVTSAEGLDNFLAMTGSEGRARLAGTPLFVPHPRIAGHARNQGIPEVLVSGPGDDELVERLVAYFDGRT